MVASVNSQLEQWNCFSPVWTREKLIQRQTTYSALEYTLEHVKSRVLTGTNEAALFEKELVEALAKSEPHALRLATVIQSQKTLVKLGVGDNFRKQARDAFP